ncbi:NAD(P)/FAD-dependent oxidoreductase [Streptomyces sp. NPDC059063]|uniref:NAD(P)/FAD-dependent oxidoreductase n=1 Tax=unclassified Streptomyces TaxID=2593676 RepID=UPI00367C8776
MYDAMVIGARCAGAATAMLLARGGARVLMLDRARFPSDTVSTHFLHPAGVARLDAWGLLPELLDTGCPPVERMTFDFGEVVVSGAPYPVGGTSLALAPRRTVLDNLLVRAAVDAGVEFRPGASVRAVTERDGRVTGVEFASAGRVFTESGRLVIGADGRHSSLARLVGAETYRDLGLISCWYYGYWSGLPDKVGRVFVRDGRFVAAFPTHQGRHCVAAGWPRDQFPVVKRDPEAALMSLLAELPPEFHEGVMGGRRDGRLVGAGDLANHYRRSAGPGWALVGDAGLVRDPACAHGMTSAFTQADALARYVIAALGEGAAALDAATAAYVRERDETTWDAFLANAAFAACAPSTEFLKTLHAARTDPERVTEFLGVYAGAVPGTAFFGLN